MLVLRSGAGASARQTTAQKEEAPFRLSADSAIPPASAKRISISGYHGTSGTCPWSFDVKFVQGLHCVFCDSLYSRRVPYTCPRCGIAGILDVEYHYARIARILKRRTLAGRPERSLWRYRELRSEERRVGKECRSRWSP